MGNVLSHQCSNKACFYWPHLLDESQGTNISRNYCQGTLRCPDHDREVIDLCSHNPKCIKPPRLISCCLTEYERSAPAPPPPSAPRAVEDSQQILNQSSQVDASSLSGANFLALAQQFGDSSDVDAEDVEQQKVGDDPDGGVDENLEAAVGEVVGPAVASSLDSDPVLPRPSRRSRAVAFDSSDLELDPLARFPPALRRRASLGSARELSSAEPSSEAVVPRRRAPSRLPSARAVLESTSESDPRPSTSSSAFVVPDDTQYVEMRSERSEDDLLDD